MHIFLYIYPKISDMQLIHVKNRNRLEMTNYFYKFAHYSTMVIFGKLIY